LQIFGEFPVNAIRASIMRNSIFTCGNAEPREVLRRIQEELDLGLTTDREFTRFTLGECLVRFLSISTIRICVLCQIALTILFSPTTQHIVA
jgi:hypothetical protein